MADGAVTHLPLCTILGEVTEESAEYWLKTMSDPLRKTAPRFSVDGKAVDTTFGILPQRSGTRWVRVKVASVAPAEAYESLIARGFLPVEWSPNPRRAFRCAKCAGLGGLDMDADHARRACDVCNPGSTRASDGAGSLAYPDSIPTLVAWFALGANTIARAESIARDGVRRVAQELGIDAPHRVLWIVRSVASEPGDATWSVIAGRLATDLSALGVTLYGVTAESVALAIPGIGVSNG